MSYGSTVAAISTPSGKGGVALIRVSGEGAIEIAEKVFKPKSQKALSAIPSRLQVYGDILKGGEVIDDGMATVFRSPASYTGEDTVEITCHGGILITEKVLEALLIAGAVPAERGEFTERAFINGKISLSEAEAIGNLLEARSDEQIRLASRSSRDMLGVAIEKIRVSLKELLASIFARIDYPDEDLGDFTNEEMLTRLKEIRKTTYDLIATYPTAKAINEGVRAVICGRTNVGKSSLYNLLLGEDAAIVTDVEGTTRDLLSRSVPLGRIMLNLSDTAGVRDTDTVDVVEKIGIERSKKAIAEAELILAVFDNSRALEAEDSELISLLDKAVAPKIAIVNKSDRPDLFDLSALSSFDAVIKISAKEKPEAAKIEIAKITDAIFTSERLKTGEDAIVASARQNAALISTASYVDSAISALERGELTDAAASEIELALGAISEIDGRSVAEEVLSEIFSKFCVGK